MMVTILVRLEFTVAVVGRSSYFLVDKNDENNNLCHKKERQTRNV